MSGGMGQEMRLITMTAAAALMVAGCTNLQPVVTSAPYDPVTGVYWTSVMGAMDTVGSDRQTGLCHNSTYGVMDERRGDHCEYGHGSGTLQGFMTNLPTAMGLAAGPAMEGAFLRPSNFNVSNNSRTSGGSVSPGAATANASPVNTATGVGGNAAGGYAVGGNSAASANPTATASPVAVGGAGGAGGLGGGGGVANARSGSVSVARSSTRSTLSNTNTNTLTVDPMQSQTQTVPAAMPAPMPMATPMPAPMPRID